MWQRIWRRFERGTPWSDGEIPAYVPRGAWLLTALVLLTAALLARPLRDGDAFEYLLMTESLARHGTPEVRPADVWSLAGLDRRLNLGLSYATGIAGYFDDSSGRWYSFHFWGYSLLSVPARLGLAVLGMNGLRAIPLTNAVVLLFALHRVLFARWSEGRARLAVALLLLTSPVVWFVRWPHPEAMTVAFATLALVDFAGGSRSRAVMWSAVASLQSPPIILLTAVLWVLVVLEGTLSRAVVATVAGLPGLLSPAFYWWHYGTPSLLAREAASLSSVSLSRTTELLFDLNVGLAPYMPVTVALFVAAAGAALVRARRSPFDAALVGVLGLAALVSTSTDNWNHATIGPSRYAVWLSPIVVFLVVRFGGTLGPGRLRTFYRSGLSLAIATQAVVMVAKRGPVAQPDYLDHSDLARFVLRHTPSLYSPSVPIFATRTTHQDPAPAGPYVYAEEGRCRKVLMRWSAAEESVVRQACGTAFRSSGEGLRSDRDWDDWVYVDY